MRRFLVVLLASLIVSGCVRYYKTRDVRSRIANGVTKLNQAITKVEADLRRKEAAAAARPTPSSGMLFGQMRRSRDSFYQHRKTLVTLLQKFNRLARNKSRIRSDEREWDELKALRERIEQLGEQINQTGQAYKKNSNELARQLAVH